MRIHPSIYQRHCNCDVYVDIFPKDKKGNLITTHAGALRCRDHDQWLKWVGLQELGELQQLDLVEADQ